jgi:uncharacterized paraquat-inducible protein A
VAGIAMICPYCQSALDVGRMSCPRCGAQYPVSGAALGVRLRTFAIAAVLLVITSLLMVDCVLHNLPRGGVIPDMKSAEARRELLMMQHHEQATQNATPPPLRR